jgi:hypothetical protein
MAALTLETVQVSDFILTSDIQIWISDQLIDLVTDLTSSSPLLNPKVEDLEIITASATLDVIGSKASISAHLRHKKLGVVYDDFQTRKWDVIESDHVAKARIEIEQLRSKVAEVQTALDNGFEAMTIVNRTNAELRYEIALLKTKDAESQTALARGLEALGTLNQANADLRTESKTLQSKNAELQTALAKFPQRIADMKDEHEYVLIEVSRLRDENTELRRIAASGKEIETLRAELDAAQKQISNYERVERIDAYANNIRERTGKTCVIIREPHQYAYDQNVVFLSASLLKRWLDKPCIHGRSNPTVYVPNVPVEEREQLRTLISEKIAVSHGSYAKCELVFFEV